MQISKVWTRILGLGAYKEGKFSWIKDIKIEASRRWLFPYHRKD